MIPLKPNDSKCRLIFSFQFFKFGVYDQLLYKFKTDIPQKLTIFFVSK